MKISYTYQKVDTIQRQSIDQNLRKLVQLAGFYVSIDKTTEDFFKDNK